MTWLSRTVLGTATALAFALANPAMGANIDTTGSAAGSVFQFASPDTATYGQTFTPTAGQDALSGFSLFLEGRASGEGTLDLRGYIAEWDGTLANSVLFESATRTMNAAGELQEFAFATNLALTIGREYVAFLSISNLQEQVESGFGMPHSVDAIDGTFVFLNNGMSFGDLTSVAWAQGFLGADDVWFKASFGGVAVPEPGTLALFGLGLAALGLTRRRGRAAL